MTLHAECVVAVLGVEHGLRKKPKTPTNAELSRAAKLPGVLDRRVRELVGATKATRQTRPPELPDYRETHAALSEGINADVLSETLVGAPQELQGPCALAFSRAVAYLNSIFPRRTQSLLTGPKLHDPSPGEWAEFGWAWRVANDPLTILDLAGDGILIGREVQHLQAMFPTLYGALCGAIGDGLADQAAKDAEWSPPWWLQKQICTVLQVSPVSATLLADIEGAVKQSQAEAKSAPSALRMTTETSTPNQRLAEK